MGAPLVASYHYRGAAARDPGTVVEPASPERLVEISHAPQRSARLVEQHL
jgi:hypothetical protein